MRFFCVACALDLGVFHSVFQRFLVKTQRSPNEMRPNSAFTHRKTNGLTSTPNTAGNGRPILRKQNSCVDVSATVANIASAVGVPNRFSSGTAARRPMLRKQLSMDQAQLTSPFAAAVETRSHQQQQQASSTTASYGWLANGGRNNNVVIVPTSGHHMVVAATVTRRHAVAGDGIVAMCVCKIVHSTYIIHFIFFKELHCEMVLGICSVDSVKNTDWPNNIDFGEQAFTGAGTGNVLTNAQCGQQTRQQTRQTR